MLTSSYIGIKVGYYPFTKRKGYTISLLLDRLNLALHDREIKWLPCNPLIDVNNILTSGLKMGGSIVRGGDEDLMYRRKEMRKGRKVVKKAVKVRVKIKR